METLDDMRKSIDNIDNAIVAMFAERFKVTDRVGRYKADKGIKSKDSAREAAQFQRVEDLAMQYGLDPEFAKSYLKAVINRVIKNHERIASEKTR